MVKVLERKLPVELESMSVLCLRILKGPEAFGIELVALV